MDNLILETQTLHNKYWKKKAPPQDIDEFQISIIQSRLQKAIMDLAYDGISILIIEMSLFYFWYNIESLLYEIDKTTFQKNSIDIVFKKKIAKTIQTITANIKDDGADTDMQQLGQNIQLMKDAVQGSTLNDIPNSERINQVKIVNETIWGITGQCMKESISPIDISGMLLYYWYRNWNIINNESEELFQKAERHWVDVYSCVTNDIKNRNL